MSKINEQTTSCWMESVEAPRPTSLGRDLRTDVCVVGAGIAGLTTAYLLACEGHSVAVLDSTSIGGGQTQRTTAHLSNAIDDRLFEVERLHGADGARLAAESHMAAIDRIEQISRMEGISCHFSRLNGYLFLAPEHKRELLEREWDCYHRAGFKDVALTQLPLASFPERDCLRFPRQGQFHPLRYLYGLAGALHKHGGRLYCDTHVEAIEGGAPVRVKTAAGPVITCNAVVVAANTPFNDWVAIHTKQFAYRTYAIAAPVPAGSVHRALYWDTGDAYHYVRLERESQRAGGAVSTNGGRELLIVGGEDHKTGQADDVRNRFQRLEAWARERFPQMGEVAHSWSGQVIETLDGLAHIGRNPLDDENVYVVTGDSGMGMTHGTIAGILLTDLIVGRDNPWQGIYDPGRKLLRAVGEFARENINVAWQYTDWLTGGDVASEDEIKPDSGAVLRSGLHKVAVYRDDEGELHRMSATCPHLGCVVHWNNTEKTWDCPCHGSRFERDGNVITGPANSGLTPVEEEAATR